MNRYRHPAASIVAILALLVLVAYIFSSCSFSDDSSTEFGFDVVYVVDDFGSDPIVFLRDPVTDVMWLRYTTFGMSFMPNPETGKPLLYDDFLELYGEYISE